MSNAANLRESAARPSRWAYRLAMTSRAASLAPLVLAAGLMAGASPTVAAGDDGGYDPAAITRECAKRTDINCVVWLNGRPNAEGPIKVKYIDDGRFCILKRPPVGNRLRCEDYWPFRGAVINADLRGKR